MIILIINLLIALAIDYFSYITVSRGKVVKGEASIKYLKVIHITLSIITYLIILRITVYRGDFADNKNISSLMIVGFLISSVWIPRICIIIFSNLGSALSKTFQNIGRAVNTIGKVVSLIIIVLVLSGSIFGRFNFTLKEVSVAYDNLPEELDGFKIVQISDLHLSSFHNHSKKLIEAVEKINMANPDIIVNTGDFVTIAWNEMAPFVNILNESKSRYGNFAIPGNHDAGTYHPNYSDFDRSENVSYMDSLIASAGYLQLKDSNLVLTIDSVKLKIAGVITRGSIPDIIFGDLDRALGKKDDADFTILLSHDPNHWYRELQNNKNINLTLSGHTHGMQLGLEIGEFQWSPVSILYPAWAGLYGKDNNYLYVNRGLGTISLPFRIGMPPEITIITLTAS